MNYYNNYTRDFNLVKLEQPNHLSDVEEEETMYKKPITIKFLRAYPIALSSVTLGTETFDTATEFEVSFTYESYYMEGPDGISGELQNIF